ncbi:MAG: hypothetical protein DU429_00585 [Candidatus Tokpelaia sp.]|nr:MAG: hypothetical protein DU430_06805 [Candidatus Tokpelaia sp.]KAA6207595.1 MAG: hypothetical protein DU429_00585 [Candidatus Tokpelaia sp.]KAA6404766.1 hypothetical protein DPQ22_07515 [Candidatus Tokpelaia sp.]
MFKTGENRHNIPFTSALPETLPDGKIYRKFKLLPALFSNYSALPQACLYFAPASQGKIPATYREFMLPPLA